MKVNLQGRLSAPLAAIPALLVGLWLLDHGAAAPSLVMQQAVVATLALLATLVAVRFVPPAYHAAAHPVLLVALAAMFFAPLLDPTPAPHRWIGIHGFRIYLAPVIVPIFLVLWHRALNVEAPAPWSACLSAALAGTALWAQPDAPQLTAFAVAAVPLVWRSPLSRTLRLSMIASALLAASLSWQLPDPLEPVPYVEGVFRLAAHASPWALVVALPAAALPVAVLVWLAHRACSSGLLAVALYFAVLLLLAPTQTTPVPLLGYGASPIIGYFLMASQAWRRSASAV